ncbi:hypothetical protein [Thiolinea disciformis]|uniref:hypothetical protein n=1 Tax=Thiolinea disciformis TaxID=125614 RepID=UPI00036ED972|nr:hypothetical protein [Thiolinea disciformis]
MDNQNHRNDSLESGQVEWRRVYSVTIALLAASAAFYSIVSPITRLDAINPLLWLHVAQQDAPLTAVACALAYVVWHFSFSHPILGSLACVGAVLCAATLVQGG